MATNSVYVTAAGAYVEIDPADAIRVTASGAYIELARAVSLRVTAVGAYVELARAISVRATAVGAYVEIVEALVDVAPVVYAHAYSPYGIVASMTYDEPAGANHLRFVWQWSPNGTDTWTTFATTDPTVKYARHFPLDPETTYYYRAYPSRFGVGELSNVASARTLAVSEVASGVALWIDVYDSSNNKLGPGPLVEIARWRNVRRLNRAGEFSVEFPATYARLHGIETDGDPLLTNDRYLYCYGMLDGDVTLLGAGIVKNIELTRNAGRAPSIVATGPDLLGELRKTTVYDGGRPYQYSIENSTTAPADLMADFAVTPFMPANWTITGGSATTAVTAKFVHASLLAALIDVAGKIGEYFQLGSSNNGRNLVWIGPQANFTDCGVRAELSADPIAAEANPAICLIAGIKEISDSWEIYTKAFVFGAGSGHDRIDLAAVTHWPDGHRLRSSIVTISGNGTTVSVTTAEAHQLTVGEDIEIVGNATYAGTYTVATTPTGTTFTYLSAATGVANAGYVYGDYFRDLDGVEHYLNLLETSLENRDARTLYGRHHTAIQFKEISPISNSSADVSIAANALLLAAYQWLRQHSAPAKFYELAVAKLDAIIYPGQTMRVVARGFVENQAYIDINQDLTILEATTEIGPGGVRTPGLVVSTVERWPTSDGDQAAGEFAQAAIYQSLAQLGPSIDTISYREHVDDDTGATLYFFLGEETAIVNQVVVRFRTDKLRSTVKSIGGSSTSTSSGGGSTATSSSGGGSTQTSSSGGGSTQTSTSYAPVENHAHGLEITDLTATGSPLYYDSAVGLNANLGTGDEIGGSTNLVTLPLTHDHDVAVPDHDHDVDIPNHTHDVEIPDHTHDVTAAISTEYGIYEDPGTAYGPTALEFSINGGTWRSDQTAISGASDWYVLDITTEIVDIGLRPKQPANSVAIRVKTASHAGNKAQITAQIERRCVIQSISQF